MIHKFLYFNAKFKFCYYNLFCSSSNDENSEPELRRVSVQNDSSLLSPEVSMSQDNTSYEDSAASAVALVREVLYGSRDNVNFIHELYRQAFLLDFTHAGAIRKAIGAYKDWIQTNVNLENIFFNLNSYDFNL